MAVIVLGLSGGVALGASQRAARNQGRGAESRFLKVGGRGGSLGGGRSSATRTITTFESCELIEDEYDKLDCLD